MKYSRFLQPSLQILPNQPYSYYERIPCVITWTGLILHAAGFKLLNPMPQARRMPFPASSAVSD